MNEPANTQKRKTSIAIDEELWVDWMKFCLDKYGSSRKASEALEDGMRTYLRINKEIGDQLKAYKEKNEQLERETRALRVEFFRVAKRLDYTEKETNQKFLLLGLLGLGIALSK